MVRSLITGGAGFIGSHVARHCLSLGHEVLVVDDLSGGFRDHVPSDATFRQGSIVDEGFVDSLFRAERFDYVYHLAAYAAEGLSHFIRRFNYTNNLIGSVNLINAAAKYGVECFVFTSSIAVYGGAVPPMHETMTPTPEDPYGISKYAVELDLEAARRMFDLNYVIFRPHNVYGENQNIGDRYRNVIGIFMNQVMLGKPMSIYGDGSQQRAFSHVDDVAPYIAASVHNAAAQNQIFNIGADKPYTVLELAHMVAQAFGEPPLIEFHPVRQEVQYAFADHRKANDIFDIRSTVPLYDGIMRMAEWAKVVGARQSQSFENIEVTKNMPANWHSVLPNQT